MPLSNRPLLLSLFVVVGFVVAPIAHAAPPAAPAAAAALAARITGAALVGGQSYAIVQSLTDRVGPRLAGTPGADRAVEWAVAQMKAVGLTNVRREPVKVPRWVRGEARLDLLAPLPRTLQVTALGGSVGTPAGEDVQAEVVEVTSIEELKALGDKARGRIVLFNKPMQRTRDFQGYGAAVPLRGRGAVEAARLGAVAALIRSVGTGAYRLVHTGSTRYDPEVPKIPFAAVAAEDAELLHRLLAGGDAVRVRLHLDCHDDGEADSANVVGELRGRERPDEIVLLGAHLDSWDLGSGAIDDGAGCAIVLETARILQALHLTPRRTIRVVLFMNEEYGLSGARAYAMTHAAELPRHVVAIEADSGAGRPYGFGATGGDAATQLLGRLTAPLGSLGVTTVKAIDDAGADLIPMQMKGVPVAAMMQDMSSYFDWHHSAADTLDKIDPLDLSIGAAVFAVTARGFAETPDRLPPAAPPQRNR